MAHEKARARFSLYEGFLYFEKFSATKKESWLRFWCHISTATLN